MLAPCLKQLRIIAKIEGNSRWLILSPYHKMSWCLSVNIRHISCYAVCCLGGPSHFNVFHELNIDNTPWGFGVNTALPVNLDYKVEAACWMIHDNFFQCMHDFPKTFFFLTYFRGILEAILCI